LLALIAFFIFAAAGILKLVGKHADIVIWLIILGGLLVSLAVGWGWGGAPWNRG
jgi:hypothetical protein